MIRSSMFITHHSAALTMYNEATLAVFTYLSTTVQVPNLCVLLCQVHRQLPV